MAPITTGGRAFCIAYALLGIPVGMVVFQHIGERLNHLSKFIIGRAKRMFKTKDKIVWWS